MNGILVVDKPPGMTSHDVVLFIRRRFGIGKVGHAGTLDPMATGVLVLLIGDATKLSSRLVSDIKEYRAEMKLGETTLTGDSDGDLAATSSVAGITGEKIKEAIGSFLGEIEQVPPMVSAVKHKGERLYKLARRGITVERKPRTVTIHEITTEKIALPLVNFRVRCSKGTYIRKLAEDIGQKLGCGAHLTSLERTASGRYDIKDAVRLERLMPGDLEKHLKMIT
jgi:tRNA pseudouridine55 synthase